MALGSVARLPTFRGAVVGLLVSAGLMAAPAVASGSGAGPVELAGPSISGVPAIGQTLTADAGTWNPAPDSLTIQWEQCIPEPSIPPIPGPLEAGCMPIVGATGASYTVTDADAGYAIAIQVIWTGAGATGWAFSDPAGVVPSPQQALEPGDLTPPQVAVESTGVDMAVPGSWSNDPTSYSYQWLDCKWQSVSPSPPPPNPGVMPTAFPCTPIPGASQLSYAPTAGDAGFNIEVAESATNSSGTGGPVLSPLTYAYEPPPFPAPVPPPPKPGPPLVVANGPLPSITGTTTVGSTLTASTGSFTAGSPITYSYQWERCDASGCESITGATAPSYKLTIADMGHKIEVVVSASDGNGSSNEAAALVGPVIEPPLSAAGAMRLKRSLDRGLAPNRQMTIAKLLDRGDFSVSVGSLPAGRLIATWTTTDRGRHGRSVEIAAGHANSSGEGATTIRLALTRQGRALLKHSVSIRLQVRASVIVTGEPTTRIAESFVLSGR